MMCCCAVTSHGSQGRTTAFLFEAHERKVRFLREKARNLPRHPSDVPKNFSNPASCERVDSVNPAAGRLWKGDY